MKAKLQILLFLMLIFCLNIITVAPVMADTEVPVVSSDELPSSSFLKKEKRSIANTLESSSLIMPTVGLLSAGESWKDPFLPGWESSDPGNVGSTGPIGDASLPIIFSFLLLYLIYRGVSTSRRKNQF
ncbi:MAG: hypothetical protein LBV43_04380 [Prevotella sp.]|jgi:hypothetical protein|nr:hypothetical protein [Prevotella sp.]